MAKKNITWFSLPHEYNLFTKSNAEMLDLQDDRIVQRYSSNTKIVVVEQTVLNGERYFRTAPASQRGLDWAFRASAFELPADDAPLAPSNSLLSKLTPVKSQASIGAKKQKDTQNKAEPKNGGAKPIRKLIAKLFRRNNG